MSREEGALVTLHTADQVLPGLTREQAEVRVRMILQADPEADVRVVLDEG